MTRLGFWQPMLESLAPMTSLSSTNFLLVILLSPLGVNTEKGKWETTVETQGKGILMKWLKC